MVQELRRVENMNGQGDVSCVVDLIYEMVMVNNGGLRIND